MEVIGAFLCTGFIVWHLNKLAPNMTVQEPGHLSSTTSQSNALRCPDKDLTHILEIAQNCSEFSLENIMSQPDETSAIAGELEASRASCAICLCDFIPARRKNSSNSAEAKNDAQPGESLKSDEKSNTENNNASSGTEAEVNRCDSLRILACRHVIHAECLEPWLLGASGRCPTCQQTVEVDAIDPEIFKS
ncbi:hypothetical protein FRC03_008035, partial [Tulasnella sp. 419]